MLLEHYNLVRGHSYFVDCNVNNPQLRDKRLYVGETNDFFVFTDDKDLTERTRWVWINKNIIENIREST